jgi:asparagine synthase (glutamine-hydrolysing)
LCGVALVICPQKCTKNEKHQNINFNLCHRGPDSHTVLHPNRDTSITFCRLAIRDLDCGGQPYSDPEGRFIGVINGELYNQLKICRLISATYPNEKIPTGDMQVLALFIFLFSGHELNSTEGMFAGYILDSQSGKFTFFRDKTGEKPLFYLDSDAHLFISSETHFASNLDLPINNEVLKKSCAFGFWSDQDHFFLGVKQFPPGSFAIFQDGHMEIRKYWSWPIRPLRNSSEKVFNVQAFEDALKESVQKTLISDVPIATLLSGGIDSALITKFAHDFSSDGITSFTLNFVDSNYDESSLANLSAEWIGCSNIRLEMTSKDLANSIPRVLAAMDSPILDSGCISLFNLSEFVSNDYKVALTGDGGDELFAGYTLFNSIGHISRINSGNLSRKSAAILIRVLLMHLKDDRKYLSLKTKLERLESVIKFPKIHSAKVALSPFAGTEILGYLISDESNSSQLSQSDEFRNLETIYRDNILPGVYLNKSDRMSMFHGLELRAPLLNDLLIQLANVVSVQQLKSRQRKFPLREIAGKYLPPQIVNAKKHGFSTPFVSVKRYLDEPDWNLERLNIPKDVCHKIWLDEENENAAIASWGLMIMNHFLI